MNNTKPLTRLAIATSGALALGLTLSGCGVIDTVAKSAADAWSVTYEVTTDGDAPAQLSEVSYLDAKDRMTEQHTEQVSHVATSATTDGTFAWTAMAIVVTGDSASVSATPPEDVSATCRILLDGAREIASETGAPGEAVHCESVTPEFD
ncbi:hypothetical protein [Leucobacter sp. G161]|uniref:hypothetical protein n=1 Tax=Leucobacter sp. G161 TaxID=663704 RepID=UPI00073C0F42|nr:hypothetical protein [Leucobacter sp. G161]KUF06213.1 hypothetical protein AUL38_02815 [Leucobacter sp. G161]